jgi:hypothetical protein
MVNEEQEENGTTEDVGEGNKYETTPIIERAREERERLEAANKKKEELLDREESMLAHKQLGGTSDAGKTEDNKKEISDLEYAEKAMSGIIDEE